MWPMHLHLVMSIVWTGSLSVTNQWGEQGMWVHTCVHVYRAGVRLGRGLPRHRSLGSMGMHKARKWMWEEAFETLMHGQ